eukprot:359833-Chlamydomonas_euryale.AAC.24
MSRRSSILGGAAVPAPTPSPTAGPQLSCGSGELVSRTTSDGRLIDRATGSGMSRVRIDALIVSSSGKTTC